MRGFDVDRSCKVSYQPRPEGRLFLMDVSVMRVKSSNHAHDLQEQQQRLKMVVRWGVAGFR